MKGDQMVERVMESLKVLNKKEEEKKPAKNTANASHLKDTTKDTVAPGKTKLTAKQEIEGIVTAAQGRKRTNTLTVGDRPNIVISGKSN